VIVIAPCLIHRGLSLFTNVTAGTAYEWHVSEKQLAFEEYLM